MDTTQPNEVQGNASDASESLADKAKDKARAVGEVAYEKAAEYGKDAAGKLGQQLKEQWKQVRANSPDFMYPSVAAAATANEQRAEANLAYYREHPQEIDRRLRELDDEWDATRVLQVATSGLTIAGFWLSLSKTKLWLLLPLVLAGGALHHGLTGQSPALNLARRLGFRTNQVVEAERRQLMALQHT
ncbi:MAG: hypothetical protein AAGK78_00740 [Planctomycetota bacterium]